MQTLADLKRIAYYHGDYEASFDGNMLGYFKTQLDAENAINDYVLDLCQQGLIDAAVTDLPDDDPLPYPLPGDENPPRAGRAIGRMWHKQPRDFIAVLSQLDVTAWLTLAEAYAEWRGTDRAAVLDIWRLAVQGASVPANARS